MSILKTHLKQLASQAAAALVDAAFDKVGAKLAESQTSDSQAPAPEPPPPPPWAKMPKSAKLGRHCCPKCEGPVFYRRCASGDPAEGYALVYWCPSSACDYEVSRTRREASNFEGMPV